MKRENLKRGMMVLTKFYEFFLRVVRVFGWVDDFFFFMCSDGLTFSSLCSDFFLSVSSDGLTDFCFSQWPNG